MLSGLAGRISSGILQDTVDLSRYESDPAGFCRDELGAFVTDEIAEMLQSVEDNVITLACSGNATGKTHGAAMAALWWYLCKRQAQVYTAAAPPESNLRNLLWGEIDSWVISRPDLFEDSKPTTLSIKKRPKEFVKGVLIPVAGNPAEREARFSGKHAPNLLFIIDEGDAVPDEVYKGIESCMSGGNARLLVLFNPRHPSGRIYELQRKRLANVVHISALTHPNVVTGREIVPGAVSRPTTLRRIHEWTRPLYPEEMPTLDECFQVPEYLCGEPLRVGSHTFPPLEPSWRRIINAAFYYMVLARYPTGDTNQLVHKEWIDAAVERWQNYTKRCGKKPPSSLCVMGQDVADVGEDWNVCYYRYGNYVANPDRWKGVDAALSAEMGAGHAKRKGAECVFVDATGVGGPVAPIQRRMGLRSFGIKANASATGRVEFGEFGSMRDQVLWAMREWFRTEEAMIPPIERLIEELKVPIYDNDKGYIRVTSSLEIKDIIKRSPDDMTALSLTFGPRRRAPLGKYMSKQVNRRPYRF